MLTRAPRIDLKPPCYLEHPHIAPKPLSSVAQNTSEKKLCRLWPTSSTLTRALYTAHILQCSLEHTRVTPTRAPPMLSTPLTCSLQDPMLTWAPQHSCRVTDNQKLSNETEALSIQEIDTLHIPQVLHHSSDCQDCSQGGLELEPEGPERGGRERTEGLGGGDITSSCNNLGAASFANPTWSISNYLNLE